MFANLSIKTRLGIAMTLLSLLLAVVGGMGIAGMNASDDVSRVSHTERLPGALAIDDTQIYTLRQRVTLDRALMADDPRKVGGLLDLAAHVNQLANESWARYSRLPKTPREQTIADTVAARLADVQLVYRALGDAVRDNQRDQVAALSDAGFRTYIAFQQACDALNQYRLGSSESDYGDSQRTFHLFRAVTAAALVLGLLWALWSFVRIRRAIALPLDTAIGQFGRIAAGDLTQRIAVQSRDEMGQLLRALETMRESLIETVASVRGGTETIASAAQQIAAGNADLSSRTEEQAASLEQTSAGMAQFADLVRSTADSAHEAHRLVEAAMRSAGQGRETIAHVTSTMADIQSRSERMADIVSIIDGIAFQTNILALNAAVEAARAGEHGSGFAVVAGEVRALAQRSSNAAREVKQLIEASVQIVKSGSTHVETAQTHTAAIFDDVRRTATLIADISRASGEQSDSIGEISRAMAQIDEVTQQNAALVEEVAAAAQSLDDQTRHLRHNVDVFVVPAASTQLA
ncbi:methyl-accepting chemotaxis protein [Paraburkholderia caballeronis]|uniref:Methyl-accepting chemotaxis sensory transducer with TarH sensor n=1 Tax=Paraburkholderia caballeronis TaxID=416943 RepID=A0A1H7SSH6_9BURK|nr:methyl-accepting chemotaxis protein [Paraburkholderia caballeronis]PXW25625.1 methyl-accepting chemotaxis sensory transducer with TarH sensor [Paraburkholderia caballeronis]PXX01232.1 methyl-accepting chemotaxis sensory transducer with TarH sensor [Paraburkholderia caballeronis]RAJ99415.1 methyl-accepting chemotaxis sensory transducer with TarH sensor [Paraburkholderia caballeronis]SEE29680.1 methyl-accepting chemotaxis sensory transducer with TarH sensor [Paraburkholderia caballeronis]SEL7